MTQYFTCAFFTSSSTKCLSFSAPINTSLLLPSHTHTQTHTPGPERSTFGGWGQASGMKLTFDLEGAIARLHPNQLDNEQAVQPSLCLFICVCVWSRAWSLVCVCVFIFFLFVCVLVMCVNAWSNVCGRLCLCVCTEKLDLPPQFQRDGGRAACYRRRVTKQYWSGRGRPLMNPVFSLSRKSSSLPVFFLIQG